MRERYFVLHNNSKQGPLTFAEVETKFNKGDFFPTDQVYLDDSLGWQSMLEFIMVHGPKTKVVCQTLQTEGARGPNDTRLDWRRFASSLPAPGWTETSDNTEPAYPLLPDEIKLIATETGVKPMQDFPPPLSPPKALLQKKAAEQGGKKPLPPQVPIRTAPLPAATVPRPPTAPPTRHIISRKIDVSAAIAQVEVLPPQASRLQIQILGEARVGEALEIVVQAMSENGNVDPTFNETVQISCNQPLRGLEPLQFQNGQARLKVYCLTQGTHQFHLTLSSSQTEGTHDNRHRLSH